MPLEYNVAILIMFLIFCNRPAPPLPRLYLSEERVNEAASFIRDHINTLLSAFEDIALGRDTELFIKVGAGLLLVSVIGGLTDFLTLGYTGTYHIVILD